jgi:hypothetical protein
VNKTGRRFIDEAYNLAFFAFGNAVAMQPDGICYTLLTAQRCKDSKKKDWYGPVPPLAQTGFRCRRGTSAGPEGGASSRQR